MWAAHLFCECYFSHVQVVQMCSGENRKWRNWGRGFSSACVTNRPTRDDLLCCRGLLFELTGGKFQPWLRAWRKRLHSLSWFVFSSFFLFFGNHRNSQVGPTVDCHKNRETEKQCSYSYNIPPSCLVGLSYLLPCILKSSKTAPPPPKKIWEQSQNKHAQRSLGEVSVWRRIGGGVTERAVCWSPFSKLSLFKISLPTPPAPKWGGFGRLLCHVHTISHSWQPWSHGDSLTCSPCRGGWWSQGHPAPLGPERTDPSLWATVLPAPLPGTADSIRETGRENLKQNGGWRCSRLWFRRRLSVMSWRTGWWDRFPI